MQNQVNLEPKFIIETLNAEISRLTGEVLALRAYVAQLVAQAAEKKPETNDGESETA
jgi:hypothetical protein